MKRLTALKDIKRPIEDVFEYGAEQRKLHILVSETLTVCIVVKHG